MNYRLTQYSHGAGCGCKISPKVLDEILHGAVSSITSEHLLVGNDTRDDAAVYDLGDGTGIISTTDFFMPIVDDPVDFGRIASVNAISDIYAMGGTPLMAIAVLGWPINTVPIEAAKLVLDGARLACNEAGIPLAGGHSIDAPEPIFGLAVTGRVPLPNLRTNAGAQDGDGLYLTKPLGVGILTTAEKKGILRPEHATLARDSMVRLNHLGATFGTLPHVHALTDVTGFGLLGHLIEMCEGADLYAEIDLASIPLIDPSIHDYIAQGSIPGGTHRNYDSYGHKVTFATTPATASTATASMATSSTATASTATASTATASTATSSTATASTATASTATSSTATSSTATSSTATSSTATANMATSSTATSSTATSSTATSSTATASTATASTATANMATSQSETSLTMTSQNSLSQTLMSQSSPLPPEVKAILCDPQTSGGLLVAASGEVEGVRIGTLRKLSGESTPDNSCRVKVVG